MKTKLFALLLILSCIQNIKAQLSWQPMAAAPKSYRLDDFYFINPNQGWVINPNYTGTPTHPGTAHGQKGQIWHTTDGGVNWQKLIDGYETFFRCVGFADSLTGWVGNLGDVTVTTDTIPLYGTTDGGHTWQPVNLPNPKPKGICGISIVTDSVIYAYGRYFGNPVVLKTSNKGATWSSTDMSSYAKGLVDAHFFNKDTGFVTGCYNDAGGQQKALILSTFDGGATWQIRHQSTRDNEEVWKIFFPSRKIGYATIEYQSPDTTNLSTYFLKTTDGGITWIDMPFLAPNNYYDLQGVGFINDTVGWIGGDPCKPTYKTTNGGLTWHPDLSLGVRSSYVECNVQGLTMNRFRSFGDTLMYASGYTVCRLATPYKPIPYFHANSKTVCQNASVTFSDSTTNTRVTHWQWNFPGGTLVSGFTLTDSMPQVTYATPGLYAVSYTASNSAGSTAITKTNYVNVLTTTAVYSTSFSESFETANVPGADWLVQNTAGKNFVVTNAAAATGNKSIMVDNFTNTPSDTSILTSTTFNLNAIGSPVLQLKISYQQKTTTNNDKFQILSSIDCGATWVSRFARMGAAFQPSNVIGQNSTSAFTPSAAQFATYTVNLSSIASSTHAMFRFCFYADAISPGNNIYVDDINIYNSITDVRQYKNQNSFYVYPNPAQNNFTVELADNQKQNLQLFDVTGKQVLSQTINGTTTIDVNALDNGVYFIQLKSEVGISTQKIIVQH